jgi:hypothetical protein
MVKKSIDGAARHHSEDPIYIGIEAIDLAVPVDLAFDHRKGGGHLLDFVEAIGIELVADHEQTSRCHSKNDYKDLVSGWHQAI